MNQHALKIEKNRLDGVTKRKNKNRNNYVVDNEESEIQLNLVSFMLF